MSNIKLDAREAEMERLLADKNLNIEALLNQAQGTQRWINTDEARIEHVHKQDANRLDTEAHEEHVGTLNGRKFQLTYYAALFGAAVVGTVGGVSAFGYLDPKVADTTRATIEIGKSALDSDHNADKSTQESIVGRTRALKENSQEKFRKIQQATEQLRELVNRGEDSRNRAYTDAASSVGNK